MVHQKITIIINQQPYHFETTTLSPQDFRDAVGASAEYEVWPGNMHMFHQ